MAPDSWASFGGREDNQTSCNPQECALLSWARERSFEPVQAQALLLADDIYAPSYRKRMLIPHEFRPGLCQEHNKTVAKAEKVTPVKVFLNPMHLLVQQAYLQDKNVFLHGDKEPARDSWACEHFQLTSEAVQVKLQKYLRIPHLQQQVPAGLNTEAAQLSWLTDLVTTDVSAWVKSILEWNGDISTGHSQLNTAAALVEAFRFSTGNAIDVWADAAQSAENVKALLGHLQLRPVQCSSVAAAIVHSIQQAASTETVDISGELFAAKLSELEQGQQRLVDDSSFIYDLLDRLSPTDRPLILVRAAAIATEHCVHVFDMDADPPVCHIFPPMESVFTAKGTYGRDNGSNKRLKVSSAAWSAVLGKDVLPKELQLSDMYARNKLVVLLKLDDSYHSCVKQSEQAGVPHADLKRLALNFMKITYDKGKQPKPPKPSKQAPTTGKKRGRPAKQQQSQLATADQLRKRRKGGQSGSQPSEAVMSSVLGALLGDNDEEEAWGKWAAGSLSDEPPFKILPEHIDFRQLSQLQPAHSSVLEALHQHAVISDPAWEELAGTVQNLASRAAAEPDEDGQVAMPPLDPDEADADEGDSDEEHCAAAVTNAEQECPAGLAPRRELPEGWTGAASSRRKLKSFEIQSKQGASEEQMNVILEELFECLELDFQLCQATNTAWSDSVKHLLGDMAQVPPKTWGKYWPLMMKYLDWASDPECQKDGPDAEEPSADVLPDGDALDECPLPGGDQVDGETAKLELELQKQVEKRFPTVSRVRRFIAAIERGDAAKDAAAVEECQLSDEQIKATGQQFGTDLQGAKDLITMQNTMARNTFADWINALGYLQILHHGFVHGIFKQQPEGLWKKPVVKSMEKQKRRLTGFIKKIALHDSVHRQIQHMTDAQRRQMAMAFLEVSNRIDWCKAIQGGAMYFYIDGMWTRAEDPRNRTMSDLYSLNYEPSGKEGTSREVMETLCFSKDCGKTVTPTGNWETQTFTHHKDFLLSPIFWMAMWFMVKYEAPGWKDVVDFPDVVAGREKGYGLQRIFCNPKTQYKSITQSSHSYLTTMARKRAGRTSFKNTYEGRTTKPNSMVMDMDADPRAVERAAWNAALGTCLKIYQQAHPADLIAKAAGHRVRDEYNPRMPPDPDTVPAFANMTKCAFQSLDRQIEQMESFNQWASQSSRDLGGATMLLAIKIIRRTWFQYAPLLERIVPQHPMFSLGFLDDLRETGVWGDWSDYVYKWSCTVEGMETALASGSVLAMASMHPPHLIVARLLEPVHEALRRQQEPGDVLFTSIWRLAGQLLLDVPDCPVQLAEAVHTLMGRDPPPALLGSPVQQVSDREAHTTEALDAISRTALTVRQQQLSHDQQQQAAGQQAALTGQASAQQQANQQQAHSQAPLTGGPVAQQPALQAQQRVPSLEELAQQTRQDCTDILSSAMKHLADSGITQIMPDAPVLQMIGAAMTPVVHTLLQQQSMRVHQSQQQVGQLQQQVDELQTQLTSVQQEVHTVRKQQVSDSTFPPLMAVALAQVTQQLHGLGRFLAAGYSAGKAGPAAGQVSPLSPRPPLNTPQRKRLRCNEDTRAIAKKQLLQADARLTSNQEAGPSRPTQTAAAVLSRSISSGRVEVYPGKAGELRWTAWGGRFKTLGTYMTWQSLLTEWREGIVFAAQPNKRTVPLEDLEKDFSEGRQKGSAQSPPTSQVPWRKIDGRNAIRDRKIIIYAALGAQHASEDVKAVMNAMQQEAQQAVENATGPGNATTVLTYMKRKIEAKPGFLSPIEFEKQILKWKHTAAILSQAASKQPAHKEKTPYPPQSIAP